MKEGTSPKVLKARESRGEPRVRRVRGSAVLPANFYIIIQQMLDSYNNNYIISTANAVIIVLQFVSISQPSLYHL